MMRVGDYEQIINYDCPKLCDETGHTVVNLMESQWKLRQQHDQNFPMKGKPL